MSVVTVQYTHTHTPHTTHHTHTHTSKETPCYTLAHTQPWVNRLIVLSLPELDVTSDVTHGIVSQCHTRALWLQCHTRALWLQCHTRAHGRAAQRHFSDCATQGHKHQTKPKMENCQLNTAYISAADNIACLSHTSCTPHQKGISLPK